jgi:hypothetical protein
VASGCGQKTGQDPHGGRLAGAVGSEEAENLAAGDREADIADRRHPGEGFHEVPDFNSGRGIGHGMGQGKTNTGGSGSSEAQFLGDADADT